MVATLTEGLQESRLLHANHGLSKQSNNPGYLEPITFSDEDKFLRSGKVKKEASRISGSKPLNEVCILFTNIH